MAEAATNGIASEAKIPIRSVPVRIDLEGRIDLAVEVIVSVAAIASAAAAETVAGSAAGRSGGGFGGGAPRGASGGPSTVVGQGRGIVKFFNSDKGFGFIQPESGTEDIFVHISSVQRAGLDGLAEGQQLEYQLVERGGKVSASDLVVVGDVISVAKREAPAQQQRQLTGEKATGTVKFFNATKGFGFINRDDGQPDAFVHISAVERAGLQGLNEGDQVEFEIEADRRGKSSAVNLVLR